MAAPLGACSHFEHLMGHSTSATAPAGTSARSSLFGSEPTDKLFGTYLSARVAGSERDTKKAAQFYAQALAQDPENNVILDQAFLHELAAGDMKKAVTRARDIVERDKTKRLAQLVVGLDDVRHGSYDTSRTHFDAAAVGPFNALASGLISAWTLEAQGRTDDAIASLSKSSDPSAFQLYYLMHKALILNHAGRAADAEKTFHEVIAAGGGDSLRVIQAYGQLLECQGRDQEALALYTAYSGDEPAHPLIDAGLKRIASHQKASAMIETPQAGVAEALYGLASALAQERSIDLPIVYLHLALYVDPKSDVSWQLLGDILDVMGRYDEANAAYDGIAKSSPLYAGAQVSMAMNMEKLGKTDAAISRLERLAGQGDLRAMVSLGDLLRNHDRYGEAAAVYTRAIDNVPKNDERFWSLYFARGMANERAGNWPAAEADLTQALSLSPGQPAVLNYLGYSWIEQGKNLDKALKMIEDAVEAQPDDGYIVDSLGWAQFKLGHYRKSVETLQHAAGLKPQDTTINDHLGDAYWRVGREIEARFQWKRALSLGADGEEAESLNHKIDFGLEKLSGKDQTSKASGHAG